MNRPLWLDTLRLFPFFIPPSAAGVAAAWLLKTRFSLPTWLGLTATIIITVLALIVWICILVLYARFSGRKNKQC